MSPRRVALGLLTVLGLSAAPAAGHEERVLVGRVEAIDPARKLLIVRGDGGERRRLEVDPETEVVACRAGSGLGVVPTGGLVRVKYLEKPGSPSEAQSILLLGGEPERMRR
jgi:hypothetical protein